jgi:hypothetical protein
MENNSKLYNVLPAAESNYVYSFEKSAYTYNKCFSFFILVLEPTNNAAVVRLPAEWVTPTSKYEMPSTAIEGGKDGEGRPLYVGRFKHEGSVIPGFIEPSSGICVSSYDTKAFSSSDFQVSPIIWLTPDTLRYSFDYAVYLGVD